MNDQISRQLLIEQLGELDHWTQFAEHWFRCDAVYSLIRRQPPADQWIPCSSGILPKHKQNVFITIELIEGRRYCTTVTYYTEMGIVDEYEWTGEGFYSYDSEYGYGKYEKVIAWMPAEPYKGE